MTPFRKKFLFIIISFLIPLYTFSKVYLVSIGVSDYPGTVNDLKLPIKDAKIISSLYQKHTNVDGHLLLDSMATCTNVKITMQEIFSKAGEEDAVVLFYSGHGYPGGLYIYDGMLDYSEIRRAMALSKSKSKMIFVDACFSGKIRPDETSSSNAEQQSKKSNVMLFLSSRSDETSYEGTLLKNSFFTTFLAKGLHGAADANHDCKITAEEIFRYVHANVVKVSSKKQHPVMWGNFPKDMPVMYRTIE